MGYRQKGSKLRISELHELAEMADLDLFFEYAESRVERAPRKKTVRRLDSMVNYSTKDQEELGFAFMSPEGGQRIAERFGFELCLVDHYDPDLSDKVGKLYADNWGDSFNGEIPQNGGFIFRSRKPEDLIWLRTFQGDIASAIYFHEIGHMLGYWLANRDETAFCEKLSDITGDFPRSYLEDLMEAYAWCLGTCMAAYIDGLCSKRGPSLFTRDCVMAVTIESGFDIEERICFRYFAAFLQQVEAKIHWHVARKPLMDAVHAMEKLFLTEFVKPY